MIKKIVLFFLLCPNLSAAPYYDITPVAKQVFGPTGVNLSLVSFQFLEDLLLRIMSSTPYEQQCACKKAATVLALEIGKRETSLATADTETKQRIEHNLAILTIQKDHYDRVARLLKKEITVTQKTMGWLKDIITRCIAFILSPLKKYTPPVQKLTDGLVRYTEIERNEILTDHKKTLRLLVCQNKYNVPLIIRFWDYPRHRHRLLNGVKKFQSSAQPQAAAVVDIAAQVGEQGAATLERETAAGAIAGVVEGAGEKSIDVTLEETGEDFEKAWEELRNIDVEGLAAQAETADVAEVGKVAGSLEKAADQVSATVLQSEGTLKEATAVLEATTNTAATQTEASLTHLIATQGAPAKEAAIKEAAEEVGQSITASTETGGTGDQTIGIYEEATKETKSAEVGEEVGGDTAQNTSNELTKEEKKALQKAAEAQAKRTAQDAKTANEAATQAEKIAAKAAKFADQAALKAKAGLDAYTKSGDDFLKALKAVKAARMAEPVDEAALDAAEASLKEATQANQIAFEKSVARGKAADDAAEEAERTAALAQPLRVTAEETKAVAQTAAKTAFGPPKTWAHQAKEFAEMAANMVLQMEISMGAQMVTAWQSAADALTFASLSQQRTLLMTNLNHFFSQLAVQQTNILAKINANFSAQIAVIASQLCLQTTSAGVAVMSGLLPSLFAVEQSFLTQALIKATVKSVFLLNPMPDDQLFYESAMATQQVISSQKLFTSNGLATTWYNPYRSGNWQFCSVDYSGTMKGPVTSFVQYTAQPFTTSYAPNGTVINSPHGDPTQAVQNSIFTEYIPPARYNTQSVESYTISVACTLLSEPYEPFMMGIMFNGARWISGVLDLHHQHRLFCIYSLPGQKPGTYNVGFAETFYQNQGQMNQTQDQLSDQNIAGLNAIWPAYQILSPDINALAAVAKSNAAHPITNPLATIPALPIGTPYIFTIETQPNQVTLTISTSDGKILYPAGETAGALNSEVSLSNQIQNLEGLTFLYHNIGFTAPGCSAQFCLRKPTDLCFSESQIKTIQASLDKGMS
jgi:hypothetical protein